MVFVQQEDSQEAGRTVRYKRRGKPKGKGSANICAYEKEEINNIINNKEEYELRC